MMNITPHVAQNDTNLRSAVDRRTTRHAGYEVSQRKRKRETHSNCVLVSCFTLTPTESHDINCENVQFWTLTVLILKNTMAVACGKSEKHFVSGQRIYSMICRKYGDSGIAFEGRADSGGW
jgi:hypothetical protein